MFFFFSFIVPVPEGSCHQARAREAEEANCSLEITYLLVWLESCVPFGHCLVAFLNFRFSHFCFIVYWPFAFVKIYACLENLD